MVPPASDKISRVPPYSGSRSCPPRTSLTRLSLSSAVLPCTFCCPFSHFITVLQPRISPVWAFSPFARRYSGNHCCFLFLRVLRCFSSPGSSPFSGMTAVGCRVPPFGYRRVFASLRLAVAFRCLARPSSVQCGQASSLRPSLLDLILSNVFVLSSRYFLRTVSSLFFSFSQFLSISPQLYFRPSVVFHIVVRFSKIDPGRHSSKTGQEPLCSFSFSPVLSP